MKRILLSDSTTHFTSPSYYCSKCNKLSSKETNCSNMNCEENKSFTKRPPVFLRMPLKGQIKEEKKGQNFIRIAVEKYFES